MSRDVIAPTRRRLTDLFVVGETLKFDDGQGEPIEVWLQKLTPGETQIAIEESRPAKAKITAIKKLPDDHPAKLRYLDQLESQGLESKLDYIKFIIAPKLDEAYLSAQARVAGEDEWAKEDYLEGLQRVWNEEMQDRWLDNAEDEEAKRVYEELKRYTDQVDAELRSVEEDLIYEMEDISLEGLQRRAANKLIEDHGDNVMINEFRKRQLYYGTREPDDHSKRYFRHLNEIDALPAPILTKLFMTYAEISIDNFEGKD